MIYMTRMHFILQQRIVSLQRHVQRQVQRFLSLTDIPTYQTAPAKILPDSIQRTVFV